MEQEYLDNDTFTFSATQGFTPGFPYYASPEELRMGDSYWVGEDGEVGPGLHDLDEIHISAAGARTTSMSISSFIKSLELQLLEGGVADRTEPDDVDLRALDYVDTPDENLICAICASAFVQPMELGCGHSFCTDCIFQHFQSGIQNSRRCPKCREEVEVISPVSTILSHLLDELEVECPNRDSGCSMHVKRYVVQDHVKQYCLFTEIPCSSQDCDLLIERRFAGEDCLHSYVECEDCLEQIMEKDLHVSSPVSYRSSSGWDVLPGVLLNFPALKARTSWSYSILVSSKCSDATIYFSNCLSSGRQDKFRVDRTTVILVPLCHDRFRSDCQPSANPLRPIKAKSAKTDLSSAAFVKMKSGGRTSKPTTQYATCIPNRVPATSSAVNTPMRDGQRETMSNHVQWQ